MNGFIYKPSVYVIAKPIEPSHHLFAYTVAADCMSSNEVMAKLDAES